MSVNTLFLKIRSSAISMIVLLSLTLLQSCATTGNNFALYLQNVEVQYETDTQKTSIINFLHDLLTIPPEQLQQKRYPDYTGKAEQWDCKTMISKYFVPDHSSKTLNNDFYQELQTDIVQQQIQLLIERIEAKNTH